MGIIHTETILACAEWTARHIKVFSGMPLVVWVGIQEIMIPPHSLLILTLLGGPGLLKTFYKHKELFNHYLSKLLQIQIFGHYKNSLFIFP